MTTVKVSLATVTATVTVPEVDYDADVPKCFWCKTREPEWVIRYEHCGHFHLACDIDKGRIEWDQRVADDATPPRPCYPGGHDCCGAIIYRATWVRLG